MKKINGNKGFTLVELIVTVVILAIITGPFLAAFVMAGNNNFTAADRHESAELAENIAEEFKGKDLNTLVEEYVNEKGKTPEFDEDGNKVPDGVYQFNYTAGDFEGIRNGFTATVRLEPASSPINGALPTVTNMKSDDTMLLMTAFYAGDKTARTASYNATYRQSDIYVEKTGLTEPKKQYRVKIVVRYLGGVPYNPGEEETPGTNVIASEYFASVPAVYAVYTPFGNSDVVNFHNELSEDDMESDAEGEVVPVNFYLSLQQYGSLSGLTPPTVSIEDTKRVPASGLKELTQYIKGYINLNDEHYTNIYTDMPSSISVTGYTNTLVPDEQSEKLYNITVTVKDSRGKTASFKSSKLNLS